MIRAHRGAMIGLLGAYLSSGIAMAQKPIQPLATERLDGKIISQGGTFDSWSEYVQSEFFKENGLRCGTPRFRPPVPEGGTPGDCTSTLTNPDPVFDPSVAHFTIPVVVHVIQNTSGSGFISAALIQSQIDILNEDFLAILGTNGGNGTDVQIDFYLATLDPGGSPTTGITTWSA